MKYMWTLACALEVMRMSERAIGNTPLFPFGEFSWVVHLMTAAAWAYAAYAAFLIPPTDSGAE